ncbi:FecR family protein [Anaerorudis cellulosivorans]|uniref:FecR family protein n=1 Tax=Anaerorudis cellulosivorans TaxID=3397862 RepID=UPI00221E4D40|nr:FecR domain-containing protein [Seramator thermalis]MCW1735497.1 FecR domain-containing protein [Seramator thermalis]
MMNDEKYIAYTTEEFVLDDDFMRWVLHPDEESDRFWNEFLLRYPEKKEEVEEAVYIIRSIRAVEPLVPSRKLKYGYTKEGHVLKSGQKARKIGQRLIKIAAVFVLIVTLGGVLYYYQHYRERFSIELAQGEQTEKGKVILPDGTISEFETKETRIQQTVSGELTINNDTVLLKEKDVKSDEPAMAQVIIPYGKRSQIILADGTKIWLNAGSTLSYPVRFTANAREVYLSGEAFFEVSTDRSKPFYVFTSDLRIKVTGTRFNVNSYSNDAITQAVLVEGKIEAAKNRLFGRSVELSPGERIVYDRKENKIQKDKVDVELYSSWVNGYLLIENEPIVEIFKKLERYYDKKIIVEKLSNQPRFTGKLNLDDDLEKVLNNIAFSANFSVENKNGLYIINQ